MRSKLFALVALLLLTSPVLADVVASGFQQPEAIATDGAYLYVLESRLGIIQKIDLSTWVVIGTFHLSLLYPTDIVIDANGNLVVPDRTDNSLRVIATSGALVETYPLSGDPDIKPLIQRLARSPDGTLNVAIHDETGTHVRRFDSGYNVLSSFNVEGSCPSNPVASYLVDLDVDDAGNIWIADLAGCGSQYELRKYAPDGTLLGAWQHSSGLPEDHATFDYATGRSTTLHGIADIFAAGSNLYVVVAVGLEDGVDVDVWTTSGEWLRRSAVSGPQPTARAIVNGADVLFVDTYGSKAVHRVNLSDL